MEKFIINQMSVVAKDVKQGDPISYDSVELPENLINNLRKLQEDS